MTRAWPRSRMALRIVAAASSAAAFANELLSLKTFKTISWLLSPVASTAFRSEDVRKVYKNPNDHKPRRMRIENGIGLKARLVSHRESLRLGCPLSTEQITLIGRAPCSIAVGVTRPYSGRYGSAMQNNVLK